MTPRTKVPYFTKLDPALREALRKYKADVGVPEAEQIDRALRAWLGERGSVELKRVDSKVALVTAGSDPPPPRSPNGMLRESVRKPRRRK